MSKSTPASSGFAMPTFNPAQAFDPTQQEQQNSQHLNQIDQSHHRQHDNDPTYLLHKPKEPEEIELRFRSYQPYTKPLKSFQLQTSKDQGGDLAWVVDETQPILGSALELNRPDFLTSFPVDHNPTWDLKRDLKSDLNTLEQRTQDSLSVLMQQKLLQSEIGSVETNIYHVGPK